MIANHPRFRNDPPPCAAGWSALRYGFAHLLDFNGAFARSRGRFAQGPQGDARAIRNDWARALRRAGELADGTAA